MATVDISEGFFIEYLESLGTFEVEMPAYEISASLVTNFKGDPLTGISWAKAAQIACSMGGRLPTVLELMNLCRDGDYCADLEDQGVPWANCALILEGPKEWTCSVPSTLQGKEPKRPEYCFIDKANVAPFLEPPFQFAKMRDTTELTIKELGAGFRVLFAESGRENEMLLH